MTNKKDIVFCHRCNEIVGDSFPVRGHYHTDYGSATGAVWMLEHRMQGFGYYIDTPKMREHLIKKFPPRKTIEVPI